MKKTILFSIIGCFILFASSIVFALLPFVQDVYVEPQMIEHICYVMRFANIIGVVLLGSFFVRFLSFQRSHAMKVASICAVAATVMFLVCQYLLMEIFASRDALVAYYRSSVYIDADVMTEYQSFCWDSSLMAVLISFFGSVLLSTFFILFKLSLHNKPIVKIRHASTAGLIGSVLFMIWEAGSLFFYHVVWPELLCNFEDGEISLERMNFISKITSSVFHAGWAVSYIALMVFFIMLLLRRKWMEDEFVCSINDRAPRFKFWIAFAFMIVAVCTFNVIFYNSDICRTSKIISIEQSSWCVVVDFSWVKFFVLHVITCAYCTLAVAREYKMRLRDLNLSEKLFSLIFVVHLIPIVNIAACIIEIVILGGIKGIESGNKKQRAAVKPSGAIARLMELESLKTAGLISSEEYSDKRTEILSGV